MRRLGFLTAIAAVTLAVIAGGLWVYLKQQFEAPGPLDREAVVIVPRGAGLSAIADDLASAGVVSNPTVFALRSEEHTSELQSLMRTPYAVFCLKNTTSSSQRHKHYKI